MKNKEYFYKETWKTDKVKFMVLCNKSEFSIKKFAQLKDNGYICKERIKIIEIKDV